MIISVNSEKGYKMDHFLFNCCYLQSPSLHPPVRPFWNSGERPYSFDAKAVEPKLFALSKLFASSKPDQNKNQDQDQGQVRLAANKHLSGLYLLSLQLLTLTGQRKKSKTLRRYILVYPPINWCVIPKYLRRPIPSLPRAFCSPGSPAPARPCWLKQ